MSDFGPPNGYAARRNDSCLSEETDCGFTINGFKQCCPGFTNCPNKTGSCCKSRGDCTDLIKNPAYCANETWTLYENGDGGYFCCVPGMDGYNVSSGVGCVDYDNSAVFTQPWMATATWLSPANSGIVATSTTGGLTSASVTATPTSEPEPDGSTSSSGSHTGAIAGGVVGGVVGVAIIFALLWFFIRRRSLKPSPPQKERMPVKGAPVTQFDHIQYAGQPNELAGQNVSELAGQSVSELASSSQPAHELPGSPKY